MNDFHYYTDGEIKSALKLVHASAITQALPGKRFFLSAEFAVIANR